MTNVIEFQASPDKWKAAARVAPNVSLSRVFQIEIAARSRGYPGELSGCDCKVMHRTRGFSLRSPESLLVEMEAKVELLQSSVKEEQAELPPLITIAVVYGIEYAIPSEPMPDEIKKCLAAFAELNGIFNAWPYLRQTIQSISTEMGYPTTLPTLRIVQKLEPPKVEAGKETVASKRKAPRAAQKEIKKRG